MSHQTETPGASAPTSARQPDRYPANIGNVTRLLWEKSANSLSREELEWACSSAECAELATQNLVGVIEGIACAINDDKSAGMPFAYPGSGGDVAALLFFVSESIWHIAALNEVGNSAADRLAHPARYKAGT